MSRVWSLSADRLFYLSGATRRAVSTVPPAASAGRLTRVRGESFYTPVEPPDAIYTDVNPPWKLAAGETIYDGMPTGVTVVNASDYTASRDLAVILNLIDGSSTPAGPVYVQFQSGDYFMNTLKNRGTATNPNWIGFNAGFSTGTKKVMGVIGAGFDGAGEFLTRFICPDTMVSSSPDNCATYIRNATSATGPVPVVAFYWSNTNANVPIFISGIAFDGDLQGPFAPYSTASQAHFARNQTASAPLAWKGMSVWRAIAGSKLQFCRFRGFSFALNSAPPFECGTVDTNYCNLTTRRIEVDGRVPTHLDAGQPRAGGGFMWNKELDSSMQQSWIHHTRRSGMATNTNTHSTTEKYTFNTFQATDIANIDASDPYPSDAGSLPGGFNSWNIEEVVGTFSITDGYANSVHSHINWAVPYSTGGVVNTLPGRTVISVKGFRTDDTLYDGCLRLSTGQRPNSSGTSPIWQAITNDGTNYANPGSAADTYFDIRRSDGVRLAPIKASLFNSAIHGPDTHYVLRTF